MTEESNVRATAERLAAARVEAAEAFLMAKAAHRGPRPLTDGEAREMAIVETKDALTIAEAEYRIALHLMEK